MLFTLLSFVVVVVVVVVVRASSMIHLLIQEKQRDQIYKRICFSLSNTRVFPFLGGALIIKTFEGASFIYIYSYTAISNNVVGLKLKA